MGFNLSESAIRLLYLYTAECVLGIVLFFIFRYFGKLYRRRFLYTWALSWLAYTVYTAATAMLTTFLIDNQTLWRAGASVVAQLTCFLQVILILRGTHELVYERPVKRRVMRAVVAAAVVASLVTVLAFQWSPDAGQWRYLCRMGSRTLIVCLGFLFTGFVVFRSSKFSPGFGQRMLAWAFLVYSASQFYYFMFVVLYVAGFKMSVPELYGIADLLLIALIGMSMIIWLLEDEREKLEKANKELDRFLYSTSHDLRAPIASILGLTYLGKLEFEEERARMFMDMIEMRIKKLDMVITDILALSRSKKIDPRIVDLDLKTLLDETITDIKFNKGASAISLHYDYSPDHVFRSDHHQMKIVLNNLLANAVKYHNVEQDHPYIRVLFRRNKDHVEIAIEDNGQGIAADSVPKIFDMFYRASTDTEGTGLGLYIVKEALSKIKGSISVTSQQGKGSCFTILLERA